MAKKGKEKQEEDTKRLSIDTPKSLYLKMKAKVALNDTTVKDYVIGLMKKGLER